MAALEVVRSGQSLNILKVESAGHAVELDVGYKGMGELKMAEVFFPEHLEGWSCCCLGRGNCGWSSFGGERRDILSLRCPLDTKVSIYHIYMTILSLQPFEVESQLMKSFPKSEGLKAGVEGSQ